MVIDFLIQTTRQARCIPQEARRMLKPAVFGLQYPPSFLPLVWSPHKLGNTSTFGSLCNTGPHILVRPRDILVLLDAVPLGRRKIW